jgi:hypothetical protein
MFDWLWRVGHEDDLMAFYSVSGGLLQNDPWVDLLVVKEFK